MHQDAQERADEFFTAYHADLGRFESAAVVKHFATPGHIVGDMGAGAPVSLFSCTTPDDWQAVIDGVISLYRERGVAGGRLLASHANALGDGVIVTTVLWSLHDSEERELYRFDAVYTLADVDGALRIVAIAHNELPRLLALPVTGA